MLRLQILLLSIAALLIGLAILIPTKLSPVAAVLGTAAAATVMILTLVVGAG